MAALIQDKISVVSICLWILLANLMQQARHGISAATYIVWIPDGWRPYWPMQKKKWDCNDLSSNTCHPWATICKKTFQENLVWRLFTFPGDSVFSFGKTFRAAKFFFAAFWRNEKKICVAFRLFSFRHLIQKCWMTAATRNTIKQFVQTFNDWN